MRTYKNYLSARAAAVTHWPIYSPTTFQSNSSQGNWHRKPVLVLQQTSFLRTAIRTWLVQYMRLCATVDCLCIRSNMVVTSTRYYGQCTSTEIMCQFVVGGVAMQPEPLRFFLLALTMPHSHRFVLSTYKSLHESAVTVVFTISLSLNIPTSPLYSSTQLQPVILDHHMKWNLLPTLCSEERLQYCATQAFHLCSPHRNGLLVLIIDRCRWRSSRVILRRQEFYHHLYSYVNVLFKMPSVSTPVSSTIKLNDWTIHIKQSSRRFTCYPLSRYLFHPPLSSACIGSGLVDLIFMSLFLDFPVIACRSSVCFLSRHKSSNRIRRLLHEHPSLLYVHIPMSCH